MQEADGLGAFHNAADVGVILGGGVSVNGSGERAPIPWGETFSYEFKNFYHPFIADLIKKLNQTSVAGMLDPDFLAGLGGQPYPASDYGSVSPSVTIDDPDIDVTFGGPYANYNWELCYHIPVMIAVHLSSNQRFAEAQNWFHLVFDPTNTDPTVPTPQRWWKCFTFRNAGQPQSIADLINLLSDTDPAQAAAKAAVVAGYNAILTNPFDPHVVARSRPSAYQWYVVMKYLDNLIAWGDSLFLADTQETINEAALCYVLAANILGPRPQSMPQPGTTAAMNFSQLRQAGLDRLSDALVDLEAQFPFNLVPAPGPGGGGSGGSGVNGAGDQSGALFGIGRSLYFCLPVNQTLLAYWDTVADRLFKIRNSENIEGVVQQLPLFDPPLDPGMLVKAAAAGIDIGSIVSGLSQPGSPVRSVFLIGKSLEIASEVRGLGAGLLAALEKGDAEQLAMLRQTHEVQLQQMVQNVRFLQWQHAQETTNGLLKTRAVTLERYTYYLRLLNLIPDTATVPDTFPPDRRELTEANFDDTYSALVSEYDLAISQVNYNQLQLAQGTSPSTQAGATGQGQMYLNKNEDVELNTHLPNARDARLAANIANSIAGGLFPIPSAEVHLAFWGIGAHSKLFSGTSLAGIAKVAADIAQVVASWETDQAGMAARTAGYQRRTDEWTLQANLAARELAATGRQIIASLIAEQIAYHDYLTLKTQVQQAQDVQSFLQTKFTNQALYTWMQSELSALYYQYYRFACDTARQAEQTMKTELMRPELDQTQFIQFNYWDTGHQGLLSGEALHLDIKRMELAYHDNNKRELELTRHVSLRQLDPLALLSLRVTGSCTVTIPEWLYDRDCPGHYMRRIKSVASPSHRWSALTRLSTARSRCKAAASGHRRCSPTASMPATRPRQTTGSPTTTAPPTRSSPAVAPLTAACSRRTCATSDSSRSRARARSAPGTYPCRPNSPPSTTPRSPMSSCTSATPPGKRVTRWARRRPRNW